jgi:predicted nucleic acid-binding protein
LILVDAGPLIALIHRDDDHHEICKQALQKLKQPLCTVWPAVVEAMYLLGFSWQAQDALWQMLASEAILLAALEQADMQRMRELMKKYRDLPMDLADAALVRLAERENISTVFTLDRKDFSVYRIGRRNQRLKIIP